MLKSVSICSRANADHDALLMQVVLSKYDRQFNWELKVGLALCFASRERFVAMQIRMAVCRLR